MNIDRMVDLKYLGLTEHDINNFGGDPVQWFRPGEDPAKSILRIMRQPKNFALTCKLLLNMEVAPFQLVILDTLWNHAFPMLIGSRGASKSTLLGLYCILRATFIQGSRIVVTGMGFRQSKQVLGYAEHVWHHAPVLRSLFAEDPESGPRHSTDRWTLRLGESIITGLPMGDGSSIRGERANVVIGDEFASISREIFETVVAGFGVVSLSPIEQMKNQARIDVMKDLQAWTQEMADRERQTNISNQLCISGTAYYNFNHFADYWRRWCQIINSKGDAKALREAFVGDAPEDLDWRDYAVIRLPVELIPKGFMDMAQVARSKATIHSGAYLTEFGAVFARDSNGFFKRSTIEGCVTKQPIQPFESQDQVKFIASLRGDTACKHVMAIDPASESDNFSIVILELHATYRKVVFCWTTNRQQYKQRLNVKATDETDYYDFCARKIRELMRLFPCDAICLDANGGGIAVLEALGDKSKLKPDESPLLPVSEGPLHDGKARESDDKPGYHMVEMVQFSNAVYISEANHGLRKDLEDKALLFPYCDPAILAVAAIDDETNKKVFDTLEDATMEIEDLKDELATITHTQTPGTLRDHWDTPEVKLPGSKKGRLRKDRYSSLLMANYAARRMTRTEAPPVMMPYGGFIQHITYDDDDKQDIGHGPDWWTKNVEGNFDDYGCV